MRRNSGDEERRRLERQARLGDDKARARLEREVERGAPVVVPPEPPLPLGRGWFCQFHAPAVRRAGSGHVYYEGKTIRRGSDWIQYDDAKVHLGWDWPEAIPLSAKEALYRYIERHEAFVIVHPSSLDSLGSLARDAEGDWVGDELLSNLVLEASKHKGPVVVIDQGWDGSLAQQFREEIRESCRRKNLAWIQFDESEEAWAVLWPKLESTLRAVKARSAWVGGLWWNLGPRVGCATAVYQHLKGLMPVRADDPDVLALRQTHVDCSLCARTVPMAQTFSPNDEAICAICYSSMRPDDPRVADLCPTCRGIGALPLRTLTQSEPDDYGLACPDCDSTGTRPTWP